jgi:hypothetical protein
MASETPTPLRAGIEARDHDAVVAAFAEDAVLWSPIFDTAFTGTDEISDLFAALLDSVWPIAYVDEIPGDPHILHFTCEVKGKRLEGIDLLHFDEQGRIKEMTVLLRPFPAIAAFLGATGPKLGRRRGGAGRAAILRAAGAPVGFLMRQTASAGPRLLGLKRRSG